MIIIVEATSKAPANGEMEYKDEIELDDYYYDVDSAKDESDHSSSCYCCCRIPSQGVTENKMVQKKVDCKVCAINKLG